MKGREIVLYIRRADIKDLGKVSQLANLLWSGSSYAELMEQMEKTLQRSTEAVFLAFMGEYPIGFAQCALRYDYVEGTSGYGNVGYLEGLYVRENYRNRGVARALVGYCEDWARGNRCVEFASDCEIDNLDSYNFHLKLGFNEANRIICFVKRL